MDIRTYTSDDAQATYDVFRQAVSVSAAKHYSPAQIQMWLSGVQNLSQWRNRVESALVCRILEDEEGVFAFATLLHNGEIDFLMCHPRMARRGAASQLLQDLEHLALAQGLPRLSTQASLGSRSVFAQNGFHVSEKRTVHTMVCFAMVKSLSRTSA